MPNQVHCWSDIDLSQRSESIIIKQNLLHKSLLSRHTFKLKQEDISVEWQPSTCRQYGLWTVRSNSLYREGKGTRTAGYRGGGQSQGPVQGLRTGQAVINNCPVLMTSNSKCWNERRILCDNMLNHVNSALVMTNTTTSILSQESIPVGCIPPACLSYVLQ